MNADPSAWELYDSLPEEGKAAIYQHLRRRIFYHRRRTASVWCLSLLQGVRLPAASLIAFGDAFKLEAHALRGSAPIPDRDAFMLATTVGPPTETLQLWSFREHLLVTARELYRSARTVRMVGADDSFTAYHAAGKALGDPKNTGYIAAPMTYEEVCVFLLDYFGEDHPLSIESMGMKNLGESEVQAENRMDDLNPLNHLMNPKKRTP